METKDSMSEWTVETLKQYIDTILHEHEVGHAERHATDQLAIRAAFDAQEKVIKQEQSHVLSLFAERSSQNVLRHDAAERAVTAAFAAQEKAISAALNAASTAVNKAEAAAEKRFEGINEFRAQLADQQRTLIPRAEADSELRAIREKLGVLAGRLDRSEGKGAGFEKSWSVLLGAIGGIAGILAIVITFLK